MKKIIFITTAFFMTACSTGPSKSKLNCERLHKDSEEKLVELQQIFSAYQLVNYDLAVKLSTPLKEQVDQLDSRVKKQKQKCWQSEKRPIDSDMAMLKEELFKVYGELEVKPVVRVPASRSHVVDEARTAPSAEGIQREDSPAVFNDVE